MRSLDDDLVDQLLPVEEIKTALVLDADRTLTQIDTGRAVGHALALNSEIRSIFELQGYSSGAFLATARAWGRIPEQHYMVEIERVAKECILYPFWTSLLPRVAGFVQVVVVTSGIPQLWKRVLEIAGLPWITVIGGCRFGTDSYFVCPEGKARLVRCLKQRGVHVIAAGDSVIDLPMLLAADKGFIVPDLKGSPRLFQSLDGLDHSLRHLAVDDRSFAIPRVESQEFLSDLMEQRC
ncbi:haloacid dehalogenase-like hydrolase [Ectothiorhodospira marina]|uniref:Phosphoserine phosphatase n=1 Tax=Ectothiorhodospira marina TaxID=1396821 RepID=A0A1H7N6T9_9GAMM|nr:haloacid dehalogenase-like hydrolase [Ectothiorhodospira marina]SEL19220.1 Phosphoserine phosphatase [Ectothiorhodospira marina]